MNKVCILSVMISFCISALLAPIVIPWLRRLKIGQTVRDDGPAEHLKKNGTPIIAITRCVSSPVSDLADYRLYTAANESLFRSGAMSSRMSQLNVVDILFTTLANADYERSLSQLSRTHIEKNEKANR